MSKELCSTKEIAEYLNMSVPFVRKLIYSNQIPFYKIGSRIQFDKNEVDKWVDERKKEKRDSILFM